jgi:transglutaminase-like putative cysteine protease
VPAGDLQDRLNRFQEFLQSEPLQQMSEMWNRIFASIDSQGPATADYYGGDSLDLGGAIQLSEQTVFWVFVPTGPRYYWRSRVFDTYENGRWLPAVDTRVTYPEGVVTINHSLYTGAARQLVEQQFLMELSASRLLYAAPQPIQYNLSGQADVCETMCEMADGTVNLSVVRPLNVLYRGSTYSAQSLISVATANELRAAGTSYPQWIYDQYRYVSASLDFESIRALALQIVTEAGATTPYDQAKAIERWLRLNITYNEAIAAPPEGVDGVEWVLFQSREGYCVYYASAMVAMLRTLDIPARMAAGFAMGTWDDTMQAYRVMERDAHTWVEVYFPGYGWIEFEPTAAQAPLDRTGDNEVPEEQPPTATPMESPTATMTATPTPTPTGMTPTPPNAAEIAPTFTPTFTPTPTQTPVIVPTQQLQVRQQPRSLLSFLLPALGIALLVVLIVALIFGLLTFIWWWWEWRGMGGLSPIARAYARLERYVNLIGIRLSAEQTPEERRRRIIKVVPKAEPPVTAITRLYSAERYGPRSRPVTDKPDTADRAWLDTRKSILKRWLRRFVPFLGKD